MENPRKLFFLKHYRWSHNDQALFKEPRPATFLKKRLHRRSLLASFIEFYQNQFLKGISTTDKTFMPNTVNL